MARPTKWSSLSARSLSGPGAVAGTGRIRWRSNRFARMKSSATPPAPRGSRVNPSATPGSSRSRGWSKASSATYNSSEGCSWDSTLTATR